jgi:hypothetical protein
MSDPRESFVGIVAGARRTWEDLLDHLADAGVAFRAPALVYTPQIQAMAMIDGRSVHIPFPDADDPELLARLPLLELLYGLAGEVLAEFVRSLVASTLAHELGHNLRVQAGSFGDDRWWEEQVANRFLRALRPRVAPPATCARAVCLLAEAERWMGSTDAAWAYDLPGDGAPVPEDPRRRAAAMPRRRRFEALPINVQVQDAVVWMRLTLEDPRPLTLHGWLDEHAPRLATGACGAAS